MKILLPVLFILISNWSYSQTMVTNNKTENLKIQWDSALEKFISSKENQNCNTTPDLPSIPKIDEYCSGQRIQVYYSRNRSEAEQKLKELKTMFPNIHTQMDFIAPDYKVKLGFFKTTQEAKIYLDKLKPKFPLSLMVQERFRCVLAD